MKDLVSIESAHAVSLYYFRTDREPEQALQARLHASDRSEAETLEPVRRLRFLASRVAIRLAAAGVIGCDLRQIAIARDRLGKPSVVAPSPLPFSLSYSGQLGFLALGGDGELGVDFELNQALPLWQSTLRRHFSEREAKWVLSAQPGVQARRFLHVWTRKEAYLKCVGTGIRSRLGTLCLLDGDRFGIDSEGSAPAMPPNTQVHLQSFDFSGYVGALACTFDVASVDPRFLPMTAARY